MGGTIGMREARCCRHYLGSHTLHNLVGGCLYGLLSNDRGKNGQKMRELPCRRHYLGSHALHKSSWWALRSRGGVSNRI